MADDYLENISSMRWWRRQCWQLRWRGKAWQSVLPMRSPLCRETACASAKRGRSLGLPSHGPLCFTRKVGGIVSFETNETFLDIRLRPVRPLAFEANHLQAQPAVAGVERRRKEHRHASWAIHPHLRRCHNMTHASMHKVS